MLIHKICLHLRLYKEARSALPDIIQTQQFPAFNQSLGRAVSEPFPLPTCQALLGLMLPVFSSKYPRVNLISPLYWHKGRGAGMDYLEDGFSGLSIYQRHFVLGNEH